MWHICAQKHRRANNLRVIRVMSDLNLTIQQIAVNRIEMDTHMPMKKYIIVILSVLAIQRKSTNMTTLSAQSA